MNLKNEGNRLPKLIGENGDKIERRMKMKYSTRLSNYRWLSISFKILILLVAFMSLNIPQVFAARFTRISVAQLQAMTTDQLKARLTNLYELLEHCNNARNYYEEPWHKWKKADRERIKCEAEMRRCYRWWKNNKPKYDKLKANHTKLKNYYNRNRSRALYKKIAPKLKDIERQMADLRQELVKKKAIYKRALTLRNKYKVQADKNKKQYLKFKHRIGKWQSNSERVVIEINKIRTIFYRRGVS